MAGVLQADGKGRMCQRIVRCKGDKSQSCGDSLLTLSCVPQSPHKAMMRFIMGWSSRNGIAEDCGSFNSSSCREQIHRSLSQAVGVLGSRFGHRQSLG